MKRKLFILFFIAAFWPATGYGQARARVAGLADNEQYMELLSREKNLLSREDSLNTAIAKARDDFRSDTGRRAELGEQILLIEAELFDVRNQTGIVAGHISALEEEYIIKNLYLDQGETGTAPTGTDGTTPPRTTPATQYPDLVRNDVFAEFLPAADLVALRKAQDMEATVSEYVEKYLANYDTIARMENGYKVAPTAAEADSMYQKYTALDRINETIAGTVADQWDYIADNKFFAYNLILEKENETGLLTQFQGETLDSRDMEMKARGASESPEIASYFIRKKLMFDYETALAELFGLGSAADSLATAARSFDAVNKDIPAIAFEERLFLDYHDVEFHSPALYNTRNPIPETIVYPKGLIYRALLGTYTSRQNISVFRGAYPLGYLQGSDSKYNYYAGGFATLEKAQDAVEELKKRGFRNPGIAVWDNGDYTLLDEAAVAEAALYRVEISDTGDALSDDVRNVIANTAQGKDISRAGTLFIVGPFNSAAEAETVAEAIRNAGGSLSVKVARITP